MGPTALAIMDLGARFASDVIGGEMGYNRQKRLQALQIKGAKELSHYNKLQQLDLWNRTNYGATVEHLKKAGLNPGLLYGMSGAGSATMGSGSVPMPTGAQAKQTGPEIPPYAIQLGLMNAQKENIEADTKLKETEANKKAGVDTEKVSAETQLLAQELDNAREEYQIKRLQQTMMNIENFEKQATQEDRIDYIEYQTKLAMKQLQMAANNLKISDATVQDQIRIIQRHAIAAALQNELTQAQTGKTKSDIQVNERQINNFIQQNMREWDKMSQENKRIAIQNMIGEFHTDVINTHKLSQLLDNIFILTQPKR